MPPVLGVPRGRGGHSGWRAKYLRAKYLAKCISERAQLSAETQDNEDAVRFDVRPPLASQVDLFVAR